MTIPHALMDWLPVTAFLLAGMLLSIRKSKLTVMAAFTGGITGAAVYGGAGYAGLCMLTSFFVIGVLATAHGKQHKAALQPAGTHPEKRTAGQVLANGGVAGIAGVLSMTDPFFREVYVLLMAGSLASATADTVSSELGTIYGRNFYNILSFRREQRGLDGVISLEGTLLGIAGAALIAVVYSCFAGFGKYTLLIILAGTAGNLLDSILGAALERRKWLHNDAVNFLNTLFAALLLLLPW